MAGAAGDVAAVDVLVKGSARDRLAWVFARTMRPPKQRKLHDGLKLGSEPSKRPTHPRSVMARRAE
jgi:hypothetical protein